MEKPEAKQLLKRARERWDAQEWLRAAELYEQVLAHYPDEAPSAAWWYDAALVQVPARLGDRARRLGGLRDHGAGRRRGDQRRLRPGVRAAGHRR